MGWWVSGERNCVTIERGAPQARARGGRAKKGRTGSRARSEDDRSQPSCHHGSASPAGGGWDGSARGGLQQVRRCAPGLCARSAGAGKCRARPAAGSVGQHTHQQCSALIWLYHDAAQRHANLEFLLDFLEDVRGGCEGNGSGEETQGRWGVPGGCNTIIQQKRQSHLSHERR